MKQRFRQAESLGSGSLVQQKDCLACQGRSFIASEKKEEALRRVSGKAEKGTEVSVSIKKKAQIALLGCTREGVLYVIDCKMCRKKGVTRQYIWKALGQVT